MEITKFDYKLPQKLIAQVPSLPRDKAKLLVFDLTSRKIFHKRFLDLGDFLKTGDVLVFNNSKVIPARLFGKKDTGGKIEVLLLRPGSKNFSFKRTWEVLLKGKIKEGQKIHFSKNFLGKIIENKGIKKIIKFNKEGKELERFIYKFGKMPIPPYIKPEIEEKKLRKYYQTWFAKIPGSVAAPTAGFHFTKRLFKKLEQKGIQFEFITLHVSYPTFAPIKTEKIESFRPGKELVIISKNTAKVLNKAKKEKRKIIAVGTTTTRALESFSKNGKILWGRKETDLFIYPGYRFKFIDGLITNFHLPRSSLILLVAAFLADKLKLKNSETLILDLYKKAIKKNYKFYSFGDGMAII